MYVATQFSSLLRMIYFVALGVFLSGFARAEDTQNLDRLGSIEERVQAVYKQVVPATVRFAYGNDRKLQFGSGVIVTSEGHIAISGPVHAVIDDKLLELRLSDGRRVKGKALGWSGEFKFGVLKMTEPGPWPHIELDRRSEIKVGELCVAIGYPRPPEVGFDENSPSLRLGAVTKSAAPIWLTSSYRFQAGAHCVFDLDGRLLGLTCITPVGGDAIQTNAAMIKAHWNDLVAGKNLDRVRLHSDELDRAQPAVAHPSEAREEPAKAPTKAAIESATPASVRISEVGKKKGLASGVIVSADGYVISCGHHERMPGHKLTVSLSDGRDVSAIVLGTNLVSDVGLLKITDAGPWPHAQMGNPATMQPGDQCVLIGYPQDRPGREPWVLKTQIIQPTNALPSRDEWYCEFWTSGYPKPESLGGISGGGVFDTQGRVIGVILGGAGNEMQHSRVELFGKQWDLLAASKPVDVLEAKPLAEITAEFSHITKELPPIAVKVLADGKQKALGTIVGSDGLVLTKASVLKGSVSCRLSNGRELSASIQKQSPQHDLAVLKIDAAGLPEARWSQGNDIARGTLIAAVVPGQSTRAGVVSIAARLKPPVVGERAVRVQDGDRGPEFHDSVFGTDIQLTPESCGGPVIDRNGRVVGIAITCRHEVGGFGQSYVIPASAARRMISD
jgi:S1-C subfamily serine protease